MKFEPCTLFIVHCTLYIVHCALCIVHCALYMYNYIDRGWGIIKVCTVYYSTALYSTVVYFTVLYCRGVYFYVRSPPPRAKIWPNDMLGEKGGKMHIFPLIGEKYAYFFPNLLLKDLIFLLQGYKRTINYDQRPIFGSDLLKYNIDINMNQE